MAMKQANAAQKQWMKDISDACQYGVIGAIYGEEYDDCTNWQLHHVKGRSFKHNKVSIGHWLILPVPFDLHDVSSNHPLNVTHHKNAFTNEFGMQTELMGELVGLMSAMGFYKIPPENVLEAIEDLNA
jgi:hypothetical protein